MIKEELKYLLSKGAVESDGARNPYLKSMDITLHLFPAIITQHGESRRAKVWIMDWSQGLQQNGMQCGGLGEQGQSMVTKTEK